MAPAADPTNGSGQAVTPHEYDVVGVGSDTTEYLLDQLSVDYQKAHPTHNSTHPYLYTWDATNPTTGATGDSIKVKAKCAKIVRPVSSGTGLTAFEANAKTSDGKHFCIDFAKSARGRTSTDPPKGKGGILFVALVRYSTATADHIPAYLEPFFAAKTAKHKGRFCGNSKARTGITHYGFLPSPLCGLGF
jgi:hypothetical protein